MKRKWKLKPKAPDEFIAEHPDYPEALLQVLFQRGIQSKDTIAEFLKPEYSQETYNPLLLPEMEQGIARTLQALDNKEKITIYADYDADAVTSATVMIRTLQLLGAEVDYYIPDRFSEGYGVNKDAIAEIAKRGTKLIITVDCGITSVEEVALANELGVDVVITDHHHVPDILPPAIARINPHRNDSKYPFKYLTGVGVAFKFVQALLNAAGERRAHIPEGWEKWLLDVVAIGTVADCQDLLSENRMLVKYGLQVLAKTRWPGLKALMSISGASERKYIDAGTIAFQIAPRINASGRLAHAGIAVELLITDDPLKAADLAMQLEKLNRQRQQMTEGIISEAKEQIEPQLKEAKILFASAPGWPKGVVGLVAGKLAEEYYRPVLVSTQDGEFATGSARSIPGFDVTQAIAAAGEFATRYGGHDAAAGFTVPIDNLAKFHGAISEYAQSNLTNESLEPILAIDAELQTAQEICLEFADMIESLAPFGQGNARPIFMVRNLVVHEIKGVGAEGKHAQIVFKHPSQGENNTLRCIAFSHGYLVKALASGDSIDMVSELLVDEWNGRRRLQLRLIDWQKATEV